MIRVTVEDMETGATETRGIENDYLIVCAGDYYVAHTNWFKNGTHVVTLKRDRGAEARRAEGGG